MHDTLAYFASDPLYRRWHHNRLTFAATYAFSESFVLPLSHDEAVHGKGSLLTKMWGNRGQQLAGLRSLYALMFAFPGGKLLFMGAELATPAEWNHDGELDWTLLRDPLHAGVQQLVRDLNALYRSLPALYVRDRDPGTLRWIEANDSDHSVYSFLRWGHSAQDVVLVVCNLTPVARRGWRIGAPIAGAWRERLNTDSQHYGGTNAGNQGRVVADAVPMHGMAQSLALHLAPMSVLWFIPEAAP